MTAQEKYNAFLDSQLTVDYQAKLAVMTDADVVKENAIYTKLKLAAQYENIEQQKASLLKQQEIIKMQQDSYLKEQMRIEAERKEIITKIKLAGYKGNACKEDFIKLLGAKNINIDVWVEQGMSKFIQLFKLA